MNQEEPKNEESFEELLRKSLVDSRQIERGQKVKAVILKITPEWTFIDLGRKSEGYIATKELLDSKGELTVKEGDTIQAYYLSAKNDENLFTTRIAGGESARAFMEDAFENGIPIEGAVEKEVKGGFEIKIAGGLRGFCPFSQMGLQRVENAGEYIGRHISFKITEYREKGRNIILSNRAVQEEARQEQKQALRESITEGTRIVGTITSIHDFGAFVDIGGIEGLIPISEISWARVEDVKEYLSIGQKVELIAKRLDWENNRFSFSLKDTLTDPWDAIEEKYPEGSLHVGKIVRLKNFGAFVFLEDGVEGLLHISKLSGEKRVRHPSDVIMENQEVKIKIDSVDKANKRLSLSLAGTDRERGEDESSEEYNKYTEPTHKSMGTLGDLFKAKMDKKGRK
ncbi:MAG: 30S ribosomal protein S1 [Syntrophobacteraceae bacterium]